MRALFRRRGRPHPYQRTIRVFGMHRAVERKARMRMNEKLVESLRQRGSLYAEFVGRVNAIASSMHGAALYADNASILASVHRIQSLSQQLETDLDQIHAQVFGEEVQS